MNTTLWVVAWVLAVAFLLTGALKLIRPKDQLMAAGMAWAEDFSPGAIKAIGAVEVLGAIGLVIPPLVNIAPVLSPIAAAGLTAVMIGAAVTHSRRGENKMLPGPLLLAVLSAFVAWGRFGPHPF